jgi:anti-anti-sigma factor
MTLSLNDTYADQLTMKGRLADDAIVVQLAGTADTAVREQLEEFFTQLHAEAVRLAQPAVVVDVRELEFMNSSCLKVFVAWLAQLRELQGPAQYKVRFRSNPNLLWQRRSLAALSCFAIDLVTIETT